jgi:hypothetical protein
LAINGSNAGSSAPRLGRVTAPDTVRIGGDPLHAAAFTDVAPKAGDALAPIATALVRNSRLFMFNGSADVDSRLYTANVYRVLQGERLTGVVPASIGRTRPA